MTSSESERFEVDYTITVADGRPVDDHAHELCNEQTVEIPDDCIPPGHHQRGIVGRVEGIMPAGGRADTFAVRVSYLAALTAFNVPQFCNMLFGNISLKNNIRVDEVRPSLSMKSFLPGPRYGIPGVRALLGVAGRPLACTALKPVGLSPEEFAKMAGEMVRGGADIVKDDHGINNQQFAPFAQRVQRVQESVAAVNAQTGRNAIYCPMVNNTPREIEKQLRVCAECGVRGVLLAPMLLGPGTVAEIAQKTELVIFGHPAFSGAFMHDPVHGMTPAFLLGTLFRLIGCDLSIFVNAGGRFPFTQQQCDDVCTALRRPQNGCAPSFPVPAGGMRLGNLDQMIDRYGADTGLLVAGNIQQHPGGVQAGMREFVEGILKRFPE